ncbi:MAG: hypothetical protein WC783_02910 [Candidatus Paceibacterota bacterium]|jgi:hypothetical protein
MKKLFTYINLKLYFLCLHLLSWKYKLKESALSRYLYSIEVNEYSIDASEYLAVLNLTYIKWKQNIKGYPHKVMYSSGVTIEFYWLLGQYTSTCPLCRYFHGITDFNSSEDCIGICPLIKCNDDDDCEWHLALAGNKEPLLKKLKEIIEKNIDWGKPDNLKKTLKLTKSMMKECSEIKGNFFKIIDKEVTKGYLNGNS